MQRDDRGQVVPLMALLLLVALVGVLVVAHRAQHFNAGAAAQTAADAAALAGAVSGEPAARTMAERNGAVLVLFEQHGERVRVVVELASATASATAERQRTWVTAP